MNSILIFKIVQTILFRDHLFLETTGYVPIILVSTSVKRPPPLRDQPRVGQYRQASLYNLTMKVESSLKLVYKSVFSPKLRILNPGWATLFG